MRPITFAMVIATLAGAHLAPALAAPKAKACGGGAVERAICANAELSALAREADRLSKLALASKQMTKEARAVFAEHARAWRGERDACGAAARECLIEQHLARILALRQITPADTKGTSRGPFVYACEGVAETVSAIAVSGKPQRAYVTWGDFAYALSGADDRFATELDTGAMNFTIAQDGATLALPGGGERACRPAG